MACRGGWIYATIKALGYGDLQVLIKEVGVTLAGELIKEFEHLCCGRSSSR